MQRSAFSLVELSIVLVILGLLAGGILSGQALIRASELRAIPSEMQGYAAAVRTFQDKYFALPGDMNNATRFWGTEPIANCPGDSTTPSTTTATCDGDGDGITETHVYPTLESGYGQENYRFWQHLANAGLIEGHYTGVAGPGSYNEAKINQNVPPSRHHNSGWSFTHYKTTASGTWFDGDYGNHLIFGIAVPIYQTEGKVLPADEAWNLDTKMDDGRPGTGKWRSNWGGGSTPKCTDAADGDAFDTAQYALTTKGALCAFRINAW